MKAKTKTKRLSEENQEPQKKKKKKRKRSSSHTKKHKHKRHRGMPLFLLSSSVALFVHGTDVTCFIFPLAFKHNDFTMPLR